MKDTNLYILIIILAIGIGIYAYNSAQERKLREECLKSAYGGGLKTLEQAQGSIHTQADCL